MSTYPPTVILRCFVVRIWLRLDSNRALHDFLAMDCYPYNRKVLKACGLTSLPDRRTFDRRLSTISPGVRPMVSSLILSVFGVRPIATKSSWAVIVVPSSNVIFSGG